MSIKRSVIFILVIILVAFFIGACGSGDKDSKKKPEQQTTQASGENAATETPPASNVQTPTEGTEGQAAPASSSTTADGSVRTQNPDGSITVVDKFGVTKVYDKDGNLISSQTGPNGTTEPSGTTQQPDATGTTPAGTTTSGTTTRGDVTIANKIAIIKTNFGDVYVFFYSDTAPTHVRNFIYLAQKGYYKDVNFHRIIKGFMAQVGEPRPDWTETIPPMNLEVKAGSEAIHRPGSLSAARTNDRNSATGQIYLAFTREGTQKLDNDYTVFGQTFKGFDILDKLQNVRTAPNERNELARPVEEAKIVDVVIEDAAKYKKDIDAWKKQNAGKT